MIADGMREDEILEAFPDLEREDIREALHYAAEAVRERQWPPKFPVDRYGPWPEGLSLRREDMYDEWGR